MSSRAMVVVGGGTSTRFGSDKLLTWVAGAPLVAHTVRAVAPLVDNCVLVCRDDQLASVAELGLGVDLVVGGPSRTRSEMAGIDALEDDYELIGIHDAARPLIDPLLVDRLFATASRFGGAVPVITPDMVVIDRATLAPVPAAAAQTPQVFEAAPLRESFRRAAAERVEGHDTADIVARFSDVSIRAVPGDPDNLKVTYPGDLQRVRERLEDPVRNGPR